MAKLHFFYSVMNAGKSSNLLQAAHNYKEKGWIVHYFTSGLDNRHGSGYITSRALDKKQEAIALRPDEKIMEHPSLDKNPFGPEVIFVDEIQFFTAVQIEELARIVDEWEIPVLCYGLKNNSNGELFGPAIVRLIALADQLKELKTVCHCGSKATQILRYQNGKPIITTDVVEVGDSEYSSVCRKHWSEAFIDA
jgi:thymidine kinase